MAVGKVLLIEDDEESAFLIAKLLLRIGYEEKDIITCHSLAEAHNVTENSIGAILCDLTLPDSTFDRTFERVFANFPYVPIIVLTGKDEHDFAAKTIHQGAQDYLVKGTFGQELLQKAIHYAIERNSIRQELMQSQADYKRMFEESPNPMFVFEREAYKILAVNIATIRQYGFSEQELLNMTMDDIRPAEDIAAFHEILDTLTTHFVDAGIWKHFNKDGTLKHVQIYSHKTRFHNIDAVITMAIDVDEKVRTKQRLKERNREITDILDSISDGFYTVNREWAVTYVNAAFEQIFGMKREETTGRSLWDCFPLFEGSPLHAELQKVMAGGRAYHDVVFSQTIQKWLSVSVYPVKDGAAIYLQNINEEYQLKEKLINNDKTLRAIINNTTDIIWSIDKGLNIVEANQSFWDRVEQQTGKNASEILAGDFHHELFTTWEQYFERAFNGEAYKTIWTEDAGGTKEYREVSFNPIYDIENEVVGISCFSRDITAEKNYQNMIEQQNSQLKEIAWLQSHKVRSQVATILGLSQFVNHQIITDPDLNSVLTGIQDAAKELDVAIREINMLTKKVEG